jgi:hypothetical protein
VRPHHLVVDDDRAVFADGAHRELSVPGHPELADQDHVDRRPDRPSDLGRHRHAAAREPDDDHGVAGAAAGERIADRVAEPSACVDAIVEHDHIVSRAAAER